jgi:CheY-like chemotaxis protein
MFDPRNVAHDKKVILEKQKHGEHLAEGAAHVSRPGKKTAREEPHGAHKETDAEKAGGSFADPSESVAETSKFLKKIGFSRVVVGTAKDAITSLRKQKFDLMFLDLQLPDAPGDQVYKTAKQIDPDLNVIVITGYPDSEMLDRILQISPVTVLKKPLKIEQLNQTVKILGHSSARVES